MVGVLAETDDKAALQTAYELSEELGAGLTFDEHGVDLLVVGSRPEAPDGRVMITSRAQNAIENSTAPVLVLARGVPVRFARRDRRLASRPTRPRLSWRRVRTLVVSDLHLGGRLEHDVLRRPEPLQRLLDALRGIDRLVLLGDVVELMEARPEQAMAVAEPVLRSDRRAPDRRHARSSTCRATTTSRSFATGCARGDPPCRSTPSFP